MNKYVLLVLLVVASLMLFGCCCCGMGGGGYDDGYYDYLGAEMPQDGVGADAQSDSAGTGVSAGS